MFDVGWLKERMEAGETLEYLYFWGHQPARDGKINQSCFSQWYAAPFTVDGVVYPTAEHWMMAGKARLFGDSATLAEILSAPGPDKAKSLGRKVRGFTSEAWDQKRCEIVLAGNLAKFGQHASLREFLLSTHSQILVEASPYDAIWGIGLAADDPRAADPRQWRGLNLLGFALMEVRERLR